MAKQEPQAGTRQAVKPADFDKTAKKDRAAGVCEDAKSDNEDKRAVADAVKDLDGND